MVNSKRWGDPSQISQVGLSEQTSPVVTYSLKITNTEQFQARGSKNGGALWLTPAPQGGHHGYPHFAEWKTEAWVFCNK